MPSATTTIVKRLLRDELAHAPDSERDFGNQNDVRPTRDASGRSDPPAIAPHHLDDHHTMVRGCRGVDLVDGIGHGVQRGVESERDFRGRQIIVDRLGHAHDLRALLKKLVADFLRPIAANRNDGIDAQLLRIGDDLVGDVAHDLVSVFFRPVVEKDCRDWWCPESCRRAAKSR
jgi:hypothetical protein